MNSDEPGNLEVFVLHAGVDFNISQVEGDRLSFFSGFERIHITHVSGHITFDFTKVASVVYGLCSSKPFNR